MQNFKLLHFENTEETFYTLSLSKEFLDVTPKHDP